MTLGRRGWVAALVAVSMAWGGWSLTAQEAETAASPAERVALLAKRAQSDPRPDTYFELGRLQFEQGDPTEGFRALARAVALAPAGHHVQTYFLHLLDKTAYKGRVELLEDLRKILPDYPPLLLRVGQLYMGKGRDQEAETLFKKWLSLRPEQAEAHARIAEFYRVTRRPEQAIAHLEQVREWMGESTYALRRLGVIYRETGKLDKSAEVLEAALDQVEARDDLVALTQLGHTEMERGNHPEAAEAFAKSVQIDPGSPAFQLFLAQAQAAAGQGEPARASFEKAIALDRFNLDAQLGMGNLLRSQGNPKGALPHLREASSRNDRDPDLHFLVGAVALEAGDLEGAQREHAKLKQIGSVTLAKELGALIAGHKGS